MHSQVFSHKQIHQPKNLIKTKRQATQKYMLHSKQILQELSEDKKSLMEQKIIQITQNVKQNIYEFVCSVLQVFKSNQTKQQTKQNTKSSEHQDKNQLNESNKNFIIQLFTQLGLLKFYNGMNRTFGKLVQQAQHVFYSLKKSMSSQKKNSQQRNKPHKTQIKTSQMKQVQIQHYKISDMFLSMKKRLQQAQGNYEIVQKLLQQTQDVAGYDIYEQSNYKLYQTKDTKMNDKSVQSSLLNNFQFKQDQLLIQESNNLDNSLSQQKAYKDVRHIIQGHLVNPNQIRFIQY